MIVVAILGILAAVAIPKFAAMLNEARWRAGKQMDPGWIIKNGHAVKTDEVQNERAASRPSANPLPDVTYYKDYKTGLCFAEIGDSWTHVPCDAVSAYVH